MLHAAFNNFSDELLKITKQHFSKKNYETDGNVKQYILSGCIVLFIYFI
jgi:hypothetical protein